MSRASNEEYSEDAYSNPAASSKEGSQREEGVEEKVEEEVRTPTATSPEEPTSLSNVDGGDGEGHNNDKEGDAVPIEEARSLSSSAMGSSSPPSPITTTPASATMLLHEVCKGYLVRSVMGYRRQRMAKIRPGSRLTTKRRELMDLQHQQRLATFKLQRWCRARICRLSFLASKPRLVREAQKRFTDRYRAAQAQTMRALLNQSNCAVQVQRVQSTCDILLDAALGRTHISAFKRPHASSSPPQSAETTALVPVGEGSVATVHRVPSTIDDGGSGNHMSTAGAARPQSSASSSTVVTGIRPSSISSAVANTKKGFRGGGGAARRIINALASSIHREDLYVEDSEVNTSVASGNNTRGSSAIPAEDQSDTWNTIMTQWVSDKFSIQSVDIAVRKYPALVRHLDEVREVEEEAFRTHESEHAGVGTISQKLIPIATQKKLSLVSETGAGGSYPKRHSVSLASVTTKSAVPPPPPATAYNSHFVHQCTMGSTNTTGSLTNRGSLRVSAQRMAKRSMQDKDDRRLAFEANPSGGSQGVPRSERVMMRYALKRAAELKQQEKAATKKVSV